MGDQGDAKLRGEGRSTRRAIPCASTRAAHLNSHIVVFALNAGSCGCFRLIRYDTPMTSPAVYATRAHWDAAGHWQRRARATHAISALDSPVTCHRGKNVLALRWWRLIDLVRTASTCQPDTERAIAHFGEPAGRGRARHTHRPCVYPTQAAGHWSVTAVSTPGQKCNPRISNQM